MRDINDAQYACGVWQLPGILIGRGDVDPSSGPVRTLDRLSDISRIRKYYSIPTSTPIFPLQLVVALEITTRLGGLAQSFTLFITSLSSS